jgi:hypothetical protein
MKMKKLILILLSTQLVFNGCKKCEDVLMGNIELMPSSINLLTSLENKTIVFKDSMGALIKFKNDAGVELKDIKINGKILCSSFDGPTDFEFFKSKTQELTLNSTELNIFLTLKASVENLSTTSTDTLLYDLLECKTGISKTFSISTEQELSKRGTDKSDRPVFIKPIKELTLSGKTFKNIIVKTNELITKNIEPLELFCNNTQGVVALRLLDGRLFVFDRIE